MNRVIGLGAGGHAKVVLDILRQFPEYQVVGLLDPESALLGTELLGIPVIGGDELLPELCSEGVTHFFVGVGSIGDNTLRRMLYQRGIASGLAPVRAAHPTAIVAPSAILGPGATIMAGAILNPCVELGVNVVVNTGAIIEHDCMIGSHSHIAPGACLLGAVHLGECVHIGARAVVRQGLSVGSGSLIGAGAVVVKNVLPNEIMMGVPASPRARTKEGGNG